MILGLGIDTVEMDRIEQAHARFGERFVRRILAPAEVLALPASSPIPFLAARFAVKEAAVKALGTGFSQGIGPTHIEVGRQAGGKPTIVFHHKAREAFERLGARLAHVSLSHSRDQACAVVILED